MNNIAPFNAFASPFVVLMLSLSGFFNAGQPFKTFVRDAASDAQPKIDFEKLPRGK